MPYKKVPIGGAHSEILSWVNHDFSIEEQSMLRNVSRLPCLFKHVALMPDAHLGKGSMIGSVIATKEAVIPATVGVDIGCGMMARLLKVFNKMFNHRQAFRPELQVNCHHNYVALEEHYGETVFVARKGAINADKDVYGIIPGSMGAKSFIVKGRGTPEVLIRALTVLAARCHAEQRSELSPRTTSRVRLWASNVAKTQACWMRFRALTNQSKQ
jgi:RNA-splicing ligase RtcB